MKGKRILVFGASGFIGTYLIDELQKNGYAITASDINPIGASHYQDQGIPFIPVDITDKEGFRVLGTNAFDSVIHLAALQPANYNPIDFKPEDYIKINVNGTLNILDFCISNKIATIIYASSHRNTSGLWPQNKSIREEDGRLLQYEGEYAMFSISESTAQDLVEFYRKHYLLRGIIFRLPPVYGFGPHLEIFKEGKPVKTGFQTFIEKAEAGTPLEVWGNAEVGRDIIYVKDVVSAFMKALESESAGGLYNITSNYKLTLGEEAETIARVFWPRNSKPVMAMLPERKHSMDAFQYDNAKAGKELNWKPVYNFESMLLDYRKERDSNRFGFLVKKRSNMFISK